MLPTVETAQDCLAELKGTGQVPHPLGNTPLVVVSTGNDVPNYKKLQAELLALSNRSRQVMAESSFHSVQIDQPAVVVNAIRQVADMVRESRH
jgi:hypothetical protein